VNNDRINLLQKYIKDEPNDPFNRYALAMEYYESQPIEALDLLEKLHKKHSDYLPVYFKLAYLYWDFDRMKEAGEIFKKGITLAEQQKEEKALFELKSAYQNFKFEVDE
jgi:tetratricopeptide (TPR) repeat protein